MKIAQVSPLYESVPPRLYGGTERVVSWLSEELLRQGHQVTVFASGDSLTNARLIPVCPQALRLDPDCMDPLAHHMYLVEQVRQHKNEFDLIHFHIDYLHFSMSRREELPQLTTLHGRLDTADLVPLYREFSEMPVVSISDAQRAPLPWMPLKIAAKIDRADKDFFDAHIQPTLNHELIEFIGEIGDLEKNEFLANAAALLFPINWSEPFGIVLIEAMACGLPVIAYPLGSVPEIIEEGVSGFLVHNIQEAIRAVKNLSAIDRQSCRKAFERRFSDKRMAHDYLTIYERIVKREPQAIALTDGDLRWMKLAPPSSTT